MPRTRTASRALYGCSCCLRSQRAARRLRRPDSGAPAEPRSGRARAPAVDGGAAHEGATASPPRRRARRSRLPAGRRDRGALRVAAERLPERPRRADHRDLYLALIDEQGLHALPAPASGARRVRENAVPLDLRRRRPRRSRLARGRPTGRATPFRYAAWEALRWAEPRVVAEAAPGSQLRARRRRPSPTGRSSSSGAASTARTTRSSRHASRTVDGARRGRSPTTTRCRTSRPPSSPSRRRPGDLEPVRRPRLPRGDRALRRPRVELAHLGRSGRFDRTVI